MKMTLEEVKDYDVLPDDSLILVEVVDIRDRHVEGRNGNEGWDKLEFKCVIRDLPPDLRAQEGYSNLIGTHIWGSTTMRFTMHPDNKLRQWSEALLNMGELDAGFELDTDMLVNRQAKAVTGHYDRKDGTTRHEIAGLLPPGPLGTANNVPAGLFGDSPAQPVPTPAAEPWAQQPAQQPAQPASNVPSWATAGDDDPPF